MTYKQLPGNLNLVMLKISSLFLLLVSACSPLGSAKVYRPSSPPEMRTAAAAIAGVDVNNFVPPDPNNPNPRIDLLPSPGKAPMIGMEPLEVLRSDPDSGAYVAFSFRVPPTKYFEVLRESPCDDWTYVQFITKDLLLSNPEKYGSGSYTGDKPTLQCIHLTHRKFRKKSDPTLEGADGVILDSSTARITETGWITQRVKIRVDGWAIKFKDPTPSEIVARLKTPAVSAVDVLQLKAIAYWIEKNKISDYSALIRPLLPLVDSERALVGWNSGSIALLNGLAATEDPAAPDDIYRTIMLSGIRRMLLPGSLHTVGFERSSTSSQTAANVIACRNQAGGKEVLRKVLLEATVRQHKTTAVMALILMGDSDFVRESLKKNLLGDVSGFARDRLAMPHILAMRCPYRSM